jgi:hypothetical protein
MLLLLVRTVDDERWRAEIWEEHFFWRASEISESLDFIPKRNDMMIFYY